MLDDFEFWKDFLDKKWPFLSSLENKETKRDLPGYLSGIELPLNGLCQIAII